MKKILKTVLITVIILGILTGGAIFLLTRSDDQTNEFVATRRQEQSDQEDKHAYRFETDSLSTPLAREGEDKNVLNFDSNQPFTIANSQASRERLNRLIRRMDATFEKPIIAYDPFGTMPNTYYFYFKTTYNCMVKYTVTVEDEKVTDHIRYVNNGAVKNMTNEHEFTVGGLIPGMTNYIVVELVDENGSHREDITYKAEVPPVSQPTKLSYERGKSDLQLQNGLFFLMPKEDPRIYIYDNNGMMRGVIATESAHGRRIYQTDSRIVYQVSPTRVIRCNRLGEIDGVALIAGVGEIIDFSYDGYENIFALTRDKNRYYLVRCSMKDNVARQVFTFDKKMVPTSLSSVTGGNLYVSMAAPTGIMRIDGLMSTRPRVGLVVGLKNDWKKTSVKKKVADPTVTEKPGEDGKDNKKSDEETDETKDSADTGSVTEGTDDTAATGASVDVDVKEPPILGWDMSNTILNLVEDESDGKTDTLTFGVVKDRLVHAVKCQIERKKKKATLLLDKEIEFEGQVVVQWGARESCVVANLVRGRYEERDEDFKVTREFTYDEPMVGLWKCSLEGFCFFI